MNCLIFQKKTYQSTGIRYPHPIWQGGGLASSAPANWSPVFLSASAQHVIIVVLVVFIPKLGSQAFENVAQRSAQWPKGQSASLGPLEAPFPLGAVKMGRLLPRSFLGLEGPPRARFP